MWKSFVKSLSWFARLPNSLSEDITNQYRLKNEGFELAYVDKDGNEKTPPIQWGRIVLALAIIAIVVVSVFKIIKLFKK